MKRRHLLAGLLMAVLAIPTLNGCGGGGLPEFDISEGGYDGSEVTIRFYHTMSQSLQDVLDIYIEEFNQSYPNIHIESLAIGGYDDVRDQLQTELAIGEQANLVYCYPDHVALYKKANSVVALDDLMNDTTYGLGLTQAQKDDFVDAYYDEGRQFGDGLMYCLPFSKSTEVLYYDKTFFDEHELTVPTTWDEMETVCRQIKEIKPNSIPLGYDSDSNWFITMCEQYGSGYTSAEEPHFLFDNQTNRNFLTEFKSWYDEGLVTTKALHGSYTSGLFTSTDATRSYMCIGSSAGATYQLPEKLSTGEYRFEVGIATIPQVNKTAPKVISQGPSLCIFRSQNRQEVIASWLFTRHLLTSVAFQAEFSSTSGYVPVLESVFENEQYKSFLSHADGGDYIAAYSAKVCTEQESAYFASPVFVGSATARDEVGALLTSVLAGTNMDIAFATALAECEYQAS